MTRIFFLFFCITFSLLPTYGQKNNSVKKHAIIDMHLHALWWGMPEMQGPFGLKAPKDQTAIRDSTFKYLEQYNIVKAVTDDAFALDYFNRDPERIIPARQGIHPNLRDPIDSLRKWFSAGTYKIMAEFMPQYLGLVPDDPQLEPYFQLAEELNIPMGIHMGLGPTGAAYTGTPNYRMAHSNPLLLENVLVKHPKLRIYIMHAGWPFIDELIGMLYAHPQLYVDVAVINWILPKKEFYPFLKRIVDAGYGERVMYGSDEMMWPQAIKISVENIQSADFLTEKQKEDIFYNNAAKFLRLSEQEIGKHKGK